MFPNAVDLQKDFVLILQILVEFWLNQNTVESVTTNVLSHGKVCTIGKQYPFLFKSCKLDCYQVTRLLLINLFWICSILGKCFVNIYYSN